MKMTIVTSARGKVIASVDGHDVSSPSKRRGMTATIVPEDGQKFHEVEVPAGYAKLVIPRAVKGAYEAREEIGNARRLGI